MQLKEELEAPFKHVCKLPDHTNLLVIEVIALIASSFLHSELNIEPNAKETSS